ncbi:MAG: 16S rRNA (uracil(1498)-N(3))-methyltransferase [Actinobacteria bacterium]|nr:16S rRNA (uracil(1498)-N(3))-methyltransferase [Actinomycetota bacterium]
MTLPLFISSETLIANQVVTLDGNEGRHAVSVRRIRVGERIELTDGRGVRATCTVLEVKKNSLSAKIESITLEPKPEVSFIAVQALAKGDRADLALEILTEVGIDVLVPWAATHSIAKWDDPEKGLAKWRRTVQEACKQSRRTRFPQVEALKNLEEVAELIATADLAIVLHETADASITDINVPAAGRVVLVIGPEGGISSDELMKFRESGANVVRMGNSVMRTSTAGGAGLACLISRTKRWSIKSGE